jgi:hypothetical protein
VASESLRGLSGRLKASPGAGPDAAHRRAARDEVDRFLARPDVPRKRTEPLPAPPGDPTGGA